jgi:predicted HTH domain antitoxin
VGTPHPRPGCAESARAQGRGGRPPRSAAHSPRRVRPSTSLIAAALLDARCRGTTRSGRVSGTLGVLRVRDTVVDMVATLEIPPEMLGVLGGDPASAADEIRLLAAMKLFELGRVSSGAAASLAGMARVEFLAKLGEYGVSPFQVSPAELEQDLGNARRASRQG